MQPVAILRARVLTVAPSSLTEWATDNTFAIESAIRRALVEADASAPAWTLDRAIEWMQESAHRLIDTTVIEEGKMVKDDYGASGSTFVPLQN